MIEDGYRKYKEFFDAPPLLIIEWHDSKTDAVGWLFINSLRGNAAGGGTRMHKDATQEECKFLAKTMEVKLSVSNPPIGGAKSVIRFDHNDSRKPEVLSRWFKSIGPYLELHYGTGGDLNVSEGKDVMPLIRETLGIEHPQKGVVVGHYQHTGDACRRILKQLSTGVDIPVKLEDVAADFNAANLITGYGLARALDYFYQAKKDSLAGKRVLVEGFGEVGSAAAYYIAQAGAKVVGIITKLKDKYRWATNDDGLDVADLLGQREKGQLPAQHFNCHEGDDANEFWRTKADVFVPAAGSHLTTIEVLDLLQKAEVKVIACGANNPFGPKVGPDKETFDDMLNTIMHADKFFSVIPDFIANCGTARLFSYLMEKEHDEAAMSYAAICAAVDKTIRDAMNRLLDGFTHRTGLLNRAYSQFIELAQ